MKNIFCFLLLSCSLLSCKKYLDAKSDQKLQLPNSIDNLQQLLDNEVAIVNNGPAIGEASADNYYLIDATWTGLSSEASRNTYIWESDITLAEYPNPWSRGYSAINIANIVLENIDKIIPSSAEKLQWENAKGAALFTRARYFLYATELWAKAYDKTTATTDLGIPLRVGSDYNIVSTRSSLQDSYTQVINDLKTSVSLLPVFPQSIVRPSKPAAYGLLARAYLDMAMYDSAGFYADKCLSINSSLMNFNNLNNASTYAIPIYNTEVVMHTLMTSLTMITNTRAKVDSNLYKSYSANDLRKSIFFKSNGDGTYGFRGSYTQSGSFFNGIATDEMMLIKAECTARSGDYNGGLAILNSLLITRWKTGTFIPFTASTVQGALTVILNERRKELIFRGLRWQDLKRLNKEAAWQQTVYRRLNGKDYILPPGDNRYALPIPNTVIQLSGIEQNPR